MYIQESGRAGRDGKLSCALILKSSCDLHKRFTSKQMSEYCRRQLLYTDFPDCQFMSTGCLCCDVCKKSCQCGKCDENLSSFFVLSSAS